MNQLQTFVSQRFRSILMLFSAGGFLMLLVELLLTHHTDGIQLVAVAATILGLGLSLLALGTKGRARLAVAMLFLLLSASGLIGAYEHYEESEGGEKSAFVQTAKAADEESEATNEQQGEGAKNQENGIPAENGAEGGEEVPPPLAPLSLSGLALLGTLTLLANDEQRRLAV